MSRLALSRICPVPYRTIPSKTAGHKQLATNSWPQYSNRALKCRRVGTTKEVGGHGRGVRGSSPRKKIQKLKPIASISGHLVLFQCTVTTMKDFLILQKTKKMLRSETNITLPREKNSKIEANCKHSQAFGAISVYMDF